MHPDDLAAKPLYDKRRERIREFDLDAPAPLAIALQIPSTTAAGNGPIATSKFSPFACPRDGLFYPQQRPPFAV